MYSHMYTMHLRRGNEERGWELHDVPELGINASLADKGTYRAGYCIIVSYRIFPKDPSVFACFIQMKTVWIVT